MADQVDNSDVYFYDDFNGVDLWNKSVYNGISGYVSSSQYVSCKYFNTRLAGPSVLLLRDDSYKRLCHKYFELGTDAYGTYLVFWFIPLSMNYDQTVVTFYIYDTPVGTVRLSSGSRKLQLFNSTGGFVTESSKALNINEQYKVSIGYKLGIIATSNYIFLDNEGEYVTSITHSEKANMNGFSIGGTGIDAVFANFFANRTTVSPNSYGRWAITSATLVSNGITNDFTVSDPAFTNVACVADGDDALYVISNSISNIDLYNLVFSFVNDSGYNNTIYKQIDFDISSVRGGNIMAYHTDSTTPTDTVRSGSVMAIPQITRWYAAFANTATWPPIYYMLTVRYRMNAGVKTGYAYILYA